MDKFKNKIIEPISIYFCITIWWRLKVVWCLFSFFDKWTLFTKVIFWLHLSPSENILWFLISIIKLAGDSIQAILHDYKVNPHRFKFLWCLCSWNERDTWIYTYIEYARYALANKCLRNSCESLYQQVQPR